MPNNQIAELTEELKQFQAEKEKIRVIVGQIGGKGSGRRESIVTGVFIAFLAILFAGDVARHVLHISVPLPPLFSLEIAVLLVSIKIIWMIRKQTKVEHFQFWILNSIEFRIDQLSNRVRKMEGLLKEVGDACPGGADRNADAPPADAPD